MRGDVVCRMFKMIHTADIHLDSPLHRLEAYEGAPSNEIRQASRRAFENLIELAVNESVDIVLIAGDLFDGDWKDYNTGLYFVKQVRRLKETGALVFIISGNHDAAGQMTRSLPYPDNVYVFSHRKPETQTLDRLKVAVHGQSFAAPAVMENLSLGYPEPVPGFFNIGMLHTSLTGREGHEPYAPCTVDDLKNKGYDYWALGHVHQYETVCDNPWIVFPGCIQGRHVKEIGPKGCVLVTVEDSSATEAVHHPLDVIRWQRLDVDLSGAATQPVCLARFVETMERKLAQHENLPAIARVVFSGETAAHWRIAGELEYWKEAVRSAALAHFGERVWIEKVNILTQPDGGGVHPSADPAPLLELEKLVKDLKADDDSLMALADELSGLFRKLPAEYRQGEGAFDPGQPLAMRQLVDQARALLSQRLKKEASPP